VGIYLLDYVLCDFKLLSIAKTEMYNIYPMGHMQPVAAGIAAILIIHVLGSNGLL